MKGGRARGALRAVFLERSRVMIEESLFAAALERTSAGRRRAFLDEACAGDVALRERVERLLAAHEKTLGILDRPAGPPGSPEDAAGWLSRRCPAGRDASAPLVAGRYKLLEAIGEGGMGTVWMAEQTQPVRRKVAVKLIKAGDGLEAASWRASRRSGRPWP